MMVTVAKNLDIPIKLLFPRPPIPGDTTTKRQYSMLGLGDIVLPGIVMGLALRFDLYLHYFYKQKAGSSAKLTTNIDSPKESPITKPLYVSPSKNWSNHFWTTSRFGFALPESFKVPNAGQFSKIYFNASLVGYISGMVATLAAMQISDHPQPALLYLVPGVLIALWSTALVRREARLMWIFTEEEEVEDDKPKESQPDLESKDDKEAKKQAEEKAAADKVEVLEKKFFPNRRNELVFFSVSPNWSSKEGGKALENKHYVESRKSTSNGEPGGKRQKIA